MEFQVFDHHDHTHECETIMNHQIHRCRPARSAGGAGADHDRSAPATLLRQPGGREDSARPPHQSHRQADRPAGL